MMVAARKGWPSARTGYAAPTGLNFYFDFGSTNMPRRRRWGREVAERRWKLASYGVAGNAPAIFMRPERTMDFRRPFWTDFVLDGEPDTLCLANFRLSRWDERRRQNHFGRFVSHQMSK
jgi:hypothetical protein